MPRIVETAFNNALATVLSRKLPGSWTITAEETGVLREHAGARPDITVRPPAGMPIVLETEYDPARTVEDDARNRLGRVLTETGDMLEAVLAVRIPGHLGEGGGDLGPGILAGKFRWCAFSGLPIEGRPVSRWPASDWLDGGIDDLAECVEQVSLSEQRIAEGLEVLERAVTTSAERLRRSSADRSPEVLRSIATVLHQEDCEQTTRMATAILLDALLFQTAIAGVQDIPDLSGLGGAGGGPSKPEVLKAWKGILDIDYWPIFELAHDLLRAIPERDAFPLLEALIDAASRLAGLGATTIQDLSGVLFQRLISDRKFLATFYTLPTSAHLLGELAVQRLGIDWTDEEAVTNLRVADFACGTGALLSAVQHRIGARLRRSGRDDRKLHDAMMERVLTGADIMPAATHLTAAILSSAHPQVPFAQTRIYTMPYGEAEEGGGRHDIGSLELLAKEQALPLFDTGVVELHGSGSSGAAMAVDAPNESFDLVIMNPPFTRPTNHETAEVPVPSFAGFATSEDEQRVMSQRLKGMRKELELRAKKAGLKSPAGNGNAGLGSNFLDLADRKVRPGGVLALVLSAAFVQGDSWSAARRLLARKYEDLAVVSIASTGTTDRAFSSDTGMAEVLVLATRKPRARPAEGNQEEKGAASDPGNADTLFVNLRQRPRTILEAVTVARRIQQADGPAGALALGASGSSGNYVRTVIDDGGAAAIVELDLARTMLALADGRLALPRSEAEHGIPVTTLGLVGERGLIHRDINGSPPRPGDPPRGPFEVREWETGRIPTYPALWAHEADRERCLQVAPDSFGEPKPNCEQRAAQTWGQTATKLHFNLDFRLNSQSLTACFTPGKTLGGRAWPNYRLNDDAWESAVLLWANTTLGLMGFWWLGSRQHEGRSIITITRLPELLTIDPRALDAGQLANADRLLEDFKQAEFLPANEAWRDESRKALDRAVLIDLLDLPEDLLGPLDLLRRQWCAEPTVHGGKATRPT